MPRPNLIWSALEEPRSDEPQLHVWENGAYRAFTWDEWRRASYHVAAGLRELGLGPGSRAAAIITNSFDACATVIGCWLAGVMLVSLPLLRRGQSLEEYQAQLQRLCGACQADLFLVDDRLVDLVRAAEPGPAVSSFGTVAVDSTIEPTPIPDGAPAFVQYSSGSVSEPKGVVLTLRAISAQVGMLMQRQEVNADTRTVMWLPLSHDMGLFGCIIVSWATGMQLAVGAPERFLRQPTTWLDDAVDMRATHTVGPDFGLQLAARRAQKTPPKGRLGLKQLVVGGERVEWRTLQLAIEVLGPYGLSWEALTPGYGLAEATLAVSMKGPRDPLHRVTVDAERLNAQELVLVPEGSAAAADVLSCGPPLDGVTVGTTNGGVGPIWLRSESLFDGYLGARAGAGSEWQNRTFETGDLGFVRDGELYVVGRTDDMIPFAGRNLYARDVERQVEQLDGVRAGCCVLLAYDRGGSSSLALVAEPSREATRLDVLADDMVAAVFHAAGVSVAECVFITPGQLPKTPSGKVQRYRCRELLTGDSDAVITRLGLSETRLRSSRRDAGSLTTSASS